jgi:hypothetical protein
VQDSVFGKNIGIKISLYLCTWRLYMRSYLNIEAETRAGICSMVERIEKLYIDKWIEILTKFDPYYT